MATRRMEGARIDHGAQFFTTRDSRLQKLNQEWQKEKQVTTWYDRVPGKPEVPSDMRYRDSMGNGSVIKPGNLQYMSAGSGVTHSEFNPSNEHQTELYQIWMLPNQSGGDPLYAEKKLSEPDSSDGMSLLFSSDGKNGSSAIRQDAEFWLGKCKKPIVLSLDPVSTLPHAWIQAVSGSVQVGDYLLGKADGLAIENLNQSIELTCAENSIFFLFRLTPT